MWAMYHSGGAIQTSEPELNLITCYVKSYELRYKIVRRDAPTLKNDLQEDLQR